MRALLRDQDSERSVDVAGQEVAVRSLVAELKATAALTTPGWLGVDVRKLTIPLPELGTAGTPGDAAVPLHVAICWVTEDDWFPVVLPLLGEGGGHLVIDAGLRTRAAGSLVRAVLTRLLGAVPQHLLDVRLVDGATAGGAFTGFRQLIASGGLAPAVIDTAGLAAVLDEAQEHVQHAQAMAAAGRLEEVPFLVVCGQLPDSRAEYARVQALAHAGPASRLHLVLAGWPTEEGRPVLDHAYTVVVDGQYAHVKDPAGRPAVLRPRRGMQVRVSLDDDPNPEAVAELCRLLSADAKAAATFTFADLIGDALWTGSSARGLSTVVGREKHTEVELSFDDVTPHWMIAGRSGSGKTVFLLDVLYGLTARYSPAELALYLLDFKEGVSFTEFTPTPVDPSWIPHARAVGVESDREYGIAVLRDLVAEMGRRSVAMKRFGVTTLPALRAAEPEAAWPRVVVVIDEFHVLLSGPPRQAAVAVGLLEDLARKGRSYGIHLVLASQTISGVDALLGKKDAIFGQFPLRVALAGATGVLDPTNTAGADLTVGQAVINDAAGATGRDRIVRFPDAHASPTAVADLRRTLWSMREAGDRPPHVFSGFAEQHITTALPDIPTDQRRRRLLVGRAVDMTSSLAGPALDATPGRHLAVIGASPIGADVLHATTTALAHQHPPGTVRFLLAPLVGPGEDPAAELTAALDQAGHPHQTLTAADLPRILAELARADARDTYLVLFGADAASTQLGARDPDTRRTPLDDLHTVLAAGPARGVHVLGWWRGAKRLVEDLGGSGGRDLIACLLALNVGADALASFTGDVMVDWQPRPNRGLLLDRHEHTSQLIVPFVRPGRHDQDGAW
ncbi:FtsK/SpoIIIE domain-containing protein [Longispora sp. NPDC051575]|uniref:FtsK/SpoIIIE domain-containing protein n=1 Tax=Longispora sp. NPDC051575 TaxID=3154943 RepID=UPI00342CF6C7